MFSKIKLIKLVKKNNYTNNNNKIIRLDYAISIITKSEFKSECFEFGKHWSEIRNKIQFNLVSNFLIKFRY
jgi:hypothetical protein